MSDKEKLKLKAAFWNNSAVAAVAGGIIVPLIGAYRDDALWNAPVFPVLSDLAYRTFLPMAAAFLIAGFCRYHAHSIADRITDD